MKTVKPVIIISGEIGSGKSTLAAFLYEALRPYGINIVIEGEDGPAKTMGHASQEFLRSLGDIPLRFEQTTKPKKSPKRKARP